MKIENLRMIEESGSFTLITVDPQQLLTSKEL